MIFAVSGNTLQKVVWTLSPAYTAVLVYLVPLVWTIRGRRFRSGVLLSWIAVVCIMFFEFYLLPFCAALLDGVDGAVRTATIPDPMPGLGVAILFGWIPGLAAALLGAGIRWCILRWKRTPTSLEVQ